jgi:glycosyltransferase involved in cell wall biosynthesis
MRTAINAVCPSINGGHKTYNNNIIKHLAKIDSKNQYFIFISSDSIELFDGLPNNFKIIEVNSFINSSIKRLIWLQIFLPFKLKIMAVDILLSPMNISPIMLRYFKIKSILVNHLNLQWLYPNDMPGGRLRLHILCFFMEHSIYQSQKVIVDSENAKKELTNKLSVKGNKVDVIHLGVDISKFNASHNPLMVKKLFKKYGINNKYLLYVANTTKHHNYIKLLEAYKLLNENNNNYYQLCLIVQITNEKHYNEVLDYIKKNELDNHVIVISNLQTELLSYFYQKATLYVFPSYCEVFGLTPLEAMSCGTPVITSNVSAMPEICGDAAMYFDPYDHKDIALKINLLLHDLMLRNRLVRKGLKRVKYYSWENTARKTLHVLEQTYNSNDI